VAEQPYLGYNAAIMLVIIATIFIDMLGVGILIPVIPLLLASPTSNFYLLPAGVSPSQGYILLGFLLAVFPLMQFFSTPILGQLSDTFGRKKLLAISLAGTCVGYILFAIAIITRNLPLLFLSRALDGITGGNISVAQAAIADITTPENRAKNFGLMGAAFGIGFILGPYIGGKLSDPSLVYWFSAATPFWCAGILSFLNMLSVIFIFNETLKTAQAHVRIKWGQAIHNIINAFAMKKLRILFLTNFFYIGGFTFFTTFFSVFLIRKFNFTQGHIGDFFSYMGIWIAFTQVVVTRTLSRYFKEHAILKVTYIMGGVFVMMFFAPSVWWGLLFVVPFFSVANGLTQSNSLALISRSVGAEIQGKVMGINASIQALAQAVPPILSGYIAASITPEAPIFIASLVIIFAGILFIVLYRSPRTVTEVPTLS